jgi:co-chaperonin GroES (HSP10)
VRTLSILFSSLILAWSAVAVSSQTPDPGIKPTTVSGKVSEINASAGQITIKTAAGSVVVANVNEKTTYQRVPPGETDLAKAEQTSLTEITVGDGVVARGYVAADQKSVPAQRIIVVSQSEIAKKATAEKMAWARGAKGIVGSVNPSTREITVTSRSLSGTTQSVIVAVDKAKIKRYPPDSIPKYTNAKPANFEDIKVGDQFNAKGTKSEDGTHLAAEEVLFGTFKIAGGTVTAIDVANNQVKINDLTTKKPLTIVFKPDSIIRRLPQGMAMMFGGGGGPGGPGGPGGGGPGGGPGRPAGSEGQAASGPRPEGQRPQGGPGGPGGPGRMGGRSMADLLEQWPTISINELKVGDTILMSSLPGSDPTQLTAIQLVTGAETLLAMAAARQQQGGQGRPQGGGVDLNGSFGGMFGGAGGP